MKRPAYFKLVLVTGGSELMLNVQSRALSYPPLDLLELFVDALYVHAVAADCFTLLALISNLTSWRIYSSTFSTTSVAAVKLLVFTP